MQVDIRHSPSSAVARCILAQGETINVESGAMYAQSSGIKVEAKMEGGLFGAAKRAILSGDSFFMSKFTATGNGGGWVDVVSVLPGDIFAIHVEPSKGLMLTKGAWLASDLTVTLDAKLGSIGTFFGGEGAFLVKASGVGKVIATAYGAIDIHSLAPGEGLTVDTGHLVAYEEGMNVNIRKISSGILNTLKSGEGLVMDFVGPGDVITQSRNPKAFREFILSMMPSSPRS